MVGRCRDSGVPGGGGEIAYGDGHVWLTVFQIPLTKIDAATNTVVKQWVGPGGDAVDCTDNGLFDTHHELDQPMITMPQVLANGQLSAPLLKAR
mgnify:CR=1 FL=1